MCAFGAVARFSPCTFIRLSLRCPLPDGHRPPSAGVVPFGILFPSHSTHEEELKKKKACQTRRCPGPASNPWPRDPVLPSPSQSAPVCQLLSSSHLSQPPGDSVTRGPSSLSDPTRRCHIGRKLPCPCPCAAVACLVTSTSQSRSDTLLERVAAEYTHHA